MSRRFIVVLALACLLLAVPREVAARPVEDLDAPVAAGSKITWRALVAKALRGLDEDAATGARTTKKELVLRRIGETERTVVPAGSPVASVEAIDVRGDGARWVVLLVGVESADGDIPGGGAAVLAAFPAGRTEPQDVADVKEDIFASFAEPETIALGPDDAFLVRSSHHNSSQGYAITALHQIEGGRLRRVDSIFTLRSRDACGGGFEQTLGWAVKKERGEHPALVATVTLAPIERDAAAECEEGAVAVERRSFMAVYRYDAATKRYARSGGDIDELEQFNEDNL